MLDLGLPIDADDSAITWVPPVTGFTDPARCALVVSHGHPDHYGLIDRRPNGVRVYAGAATRRILREAQFFTRLGADIPAGLPLEDRKPFRHGPFTVTPYLVDHSAFDSYSLLVEAGGKRLLYSGDFRAAGRKSALYERFIDEPPRDVDVLLLEGTTLGRPSGQKTTEQDVEERCVDLFRHTRGVVLACYSAQNIDRVVTLHRAARRSGRKLVLDLYGAEMARATGRPDSIPQADWGSINTYAPVNQRIRVKQTGQFDRMRRIRSRRLYPEDLADRARGLVLTFRLSMAREITAAHCLDGASVLWSMWPGYLDRPSGARLRAWCGDEGLPLSVSHASGHAAPDDLRRYARAVSARQVVPVHTEHPDRFSPAISNTHVRRDGEWWEV